MRYPDQHLSADELESLGREEGLSDGLREDLGAAREHVQSCPSCRRRLEVYPTTGAKLEKLRAPQRAPKGPDCPSVEVWLNVAGGLLTTAQKERYVTHAATCDHCGPVLREIVHDFEEPVTEEEKAVMAGLKSSGSIPPPKTATYNKPITQVIPSRIVPALRRWFRFPVWQLATVAVVVLAAVSFSLYRLGMFNKEDSVASVNRLLAQAYTEQRTVEMRIPGADYGPVRVTRGSEQSLLIRPAAWLEADAIISREMPKRPDDPGWLQARARAALLEWGYDSALQDLNEALTIKPNDPSLLLDKATALYERAAKREADSGDYREAANPLNKVLEINPDNSVALFNRALVYEKLLLYPEAIEDWEHFLRLEPRGLWAEEADKRLNELKKKVRVHDVGSPASLIDAKALATLWLANDPSAISNVDRRIEAYQGLALQEWLPRLFVKEKNSTNTHEILLALHALSTLLIERHGDRWLSDLLGTARSADFSVGIAALTDALRQNDVGNARVALSQSEKAARVFSKTANRAGELRSRVEKAHAFRRLQEGKECLRESEATAIELEGLAYPWIKTQLEIDRSSCALMLGNFELAQSYADRAIANAQGSRYPVLTLRAIGLAASVETDEGNLAEAWRKDQDGLSQYWNDEFAPPLRAQQFYDDLMVSTEDTGDWNLALAFGRESVRAISLTPDRANEATIRRHLAGLAIRIKDFKLAALELAKAANLQVALSKEDKTGGEYVYSQMDLSEIALEEGSPDRAAAILDATNADWTIVNSFEIEMNFYWLYGRAMQAQNQPAKALEAFWNAASVAEANLRSIDNRLARELWVLEMSEIFRALAGLELAQGNSEIAFYIWERYKADAFERPVSSLRPQTHVVAPRADTVVLSYAALPQGIMLWVLDEQGLSAHALTPDADALRESLRSFAQMCAEPDSDLLRLRLRGRALYDVLVGPVAARLPSNKVLVVEPDDLFPDFPFAALVTDNGDYLGTQYRLVESPGIFFTRYVRASSPILFSDKALVVGSTAILGSLRPAPGVTKEAESIARKLPNSIPLISDKATVRAVESSLPNVDIFHFAGHALSSDSGEGLVLFDPSDGAAGKVVLWGAARAKPSLFKRCKLVVFSACSTGRKSKVKENNSIGLVRAALLARVPRVIASQWDVRSDVTAEFMNFFYVNLLSGQSVERALQAAAAALKKNPDTQHPYYWAAFKAFGTT